MTAESTVALRLRAATIIAAPLLLASLAAPAIADDKASVIINCDASCDAVIQDVLAMGGSITHKYDNFSAVAVEVSVGQRSALMGSAGIVSTQKDIMIEGPKPMESFNIDVAAGTQPMLGEELFSAIEDMPADYNFNNGLIGASALHAEGYGGEGTIVGIIDSGTANNADVVPAIAGDVIGGENFVPGDGEPSATSTQNGSHGTWVGTQVSANAGFLVSTGSTIAQSVATHAPDSILMDFPAEGIALLPMIGVAPEAKLYAFKVFAAAGGGSPNSRILAAVDRAITMRRNYNDGMPSVPVAGDGSEDNPYVYDSLKIDVLNMSLGGARLFVAGGLEDELSRELLDVGITLVASAGNEGHAAMTGGAPGTSSGALTSGAMSTPAHERILRDLQFGLGIGALYRPSNHLQMATFSSRGPSADGRISTNAVASGFATFSQSAGGGLNVVSGTSFSAPQMAGAAALLRQAAPDATAVQIRNALMDYANPNLLGDGSAPIDQGNGVIDIPAALAALQAGVVRSDLEEGLRDHRVAQNVKALGFNIVDADGGTVTTRVEDLLPGQVAHIFLRSSRNTDGYTVSLSNFDKELPESEQNALFGDDIFLLAQDAITSDEAPIGGGFFGSDASIEIVDPQTGLVRLGVMGDWTNAGRISADVTITEHTSPIPNQSAEGDVQQGESDVIFLDVPEGAAQATFELSWTNNWGAYPTDDLDMIMIDPTGAVIFDGATLASPEKVTIDSPAAGTWIVLIDGFTVHGIIGDDPNSYYEFAAYADGERLPGL